MLNSFLPRYFYRNIFYRNIFYRNIPNRNTIYRSILLTLVICFGLACSLRKPFVKPEVSVVNLQMGNATFFETTATFDVRIDNENDYPLEINGGVHRLYLNNVYLGKGFDRESFRIPRLSSVTRAVEIHISNLRLLTRLQSFVQQDSLSYKVESKLHPKGRWSNVNVSDSGRFEFSQLIGRGESAIRRFSSTPLLN